MFIYADYTLLRTSSWSHPTKNCPFIPGSGGFTHLSFVLTVGKQGRSIIWCLVSCYQRTSPTGCCSGRCDLIIKTSTLEFVRKLYISEKLCLDCRLSGLWLFSRVAWSTCGLWFITAHIILYVSAGSCAAVFVLLGPDRHRHVSSQQ